MLGRSSRLVWDFLVGLLPLTQLVAFLSTSFVLNSGPIIRLGEFSIWI